MSNAKIATGDKKQETSMPKSPFSKFSKFGAQPNMLGGQKFTPKGIVVRPTFVTQHKGGGGK